MEQLVTESEKLIQWLDKSIDGLEIKEDTRSRLAAGCFDIGLEHHRAIILLVAKKHYGSAYSLLRLMFEAYVRGVWLYRCASDIELEMYRNEKLPKIGSLLKEIEKLEGFSEGVLSDLKKRSWGVLNSYTHSGYLQVLRRNTEATIESNYETSEIIEVVEFVNTFALIIAVAIAQLAGSDPLAKALLDKAREINPKGLGNGVSK